MNAGHTSGLPDHGAPGSADVTDHHQERVEPRDARQSSFDRAGRHARLAIGQTHHSAVTARSALLGDERQHIDRGNIDRRLVDHREEGAEIRHRRQHRVRPRPRHDELDIAIQQRITELRQTISACNTRRSDKDLEWATGAPSSLCDLSQRQATKDFKDHRHIYASPNACRCRALGLCRWHVRGWMVVHEMAA